MYGDKDEDEFYYGETREGLKGFVPSNMVMELGSSPQNHPHNNSAGAANRHAKGTQNWKVKFVFAQVEVPDRKPICPEPDERTTGVSCIQIYII